jgi:hypothetical protein
MKPGPESVIRLFQLLALTVLLGLLPPSASAQKGAPPPPPPPKKSAPAPSHPAPAPASHPSGHDNPGHPGGAPAAGHSGGDNGKMGNGGSHDGKTNTNNTANGHTSTGPNAGGNRPMGNVGNANHANNNANNRNNPAPPANETTVRDITPNSASGKSGANSKVTGNSPPSNAKTAWGAPANKNAANANRVNNQPGTHPLPNGGTRIVKANGSAVEKNKDGKVTGVTTAKGVTVKLDAHGHPAAIHDGHTTTISRGPHGERRVETLRADRSRLVSTGRHRGFAEQRFTQGGKDYARRSYYDHGHTFARVYHPYFYGGYPFYSYVPTFYYGPAYYGWAYNGWPVPVPYTWGWYRSPWFAPYGYYFSPYAAYPAPAFWIADYAIAASLQAAAEETGSASLRHQAGVVLASAHPDDQNGGASVVMSKELKDTIAQQVKIIIADEKTAAAAQGNLPPDEDADQVPPSLDPRFKLFIAFSSLSLDTNDGACALTAGDIVRRTEDTPDANNTLSVEVVSSKKDDCAVGTASRMALDDLEEMHDSFRQKIDDGLKSLSENQGKGGIPNGPAATVHPLPEGETTPDPTVESDLEKQQQAADATEKDVQDISPDSGSVN